MNFMEERLNKDGIKYLSTLIRAPILMAFVFFLAAGRLDIIRAWVAFGIHLFGGIVGVILLWKFSPGLANQRASARSGTKKWDKAIVPIIYSLLLIIQLVAGLDVGRYRFSQLGGNFAIGGIILYVAYFILLYWSMLANEYFEISSRVQKDRGHKVINKGPYGFVRHPGYVAVILFSLADSFVIGSFYALIPAALVIFMTFIRTFLEDNMLQKELKGYSEYANQTKYRLLPGIW